MKEALPYLAFSMGLMSSFHCIGMCGPISLALPVHKGTNLQKMTGLFLYNMGRAITYALLGLIVGSIGQAFSWFGLFRYMAIFIGVLMLSYALWPFQLDTKLHTPSVWQKLIQMLKRQMQLRLKTNTKLSWFLIGSLNGLLPCGMVYMALMTSLATGHHLQGSLFLFIFGLGTFPAMLAVGFFQKWFSPQIRTRIKKATPILMATAGIWLIVRGLLIEYPTHLSHKSDSITICH
jgi:sulfite exporter TauE/SafE